MIPEPWQKVLPQETVIQAKALSQRAQTEREEGATI